MGQFIANINTNEDKDELANMILNYEMLLMEKLNFELTVHNFYRPFEGIMLDIKVKKYKLSVKIHMVFSCDFFSSLV